MDKNDNGEIGESGQIDDNSGYIQESTYLPETESRIPETETVDNSIGDGLPGGSAHGVKSTKAKKSFIKDNVALLVVGGIVLFVGGAVGYKKMTQQTGAQVAAQVSPVAPQVEQISALPPEPVLPEVATAQNKDVLNVVDGSVSVNGGGGAEQTSVAVSSSASPAASMQKEASVTQSAIPKTQTPLAATSPSVQVPSSAPMGSGMANAKADADSELKERLAATEKKLKDAEREIENMSQRVSAASPAVAANCAPVVAYKGLPKTTKKVMKQKNVKVPAKKKVMVEEAAGFNVKVIKNGLAWIQTSSGKTVIVREGDVVADLGKVTKIDDVNMQVLAGSKRVEQK